MNSQRRDAVEKGFEQDRRDYWAMRDALLRKYAGKWVAVHKGRVVAVVCQGFQIESPIATNKVKVLFISCVHGRSNLQSAKGNQDIIE